MVIDERVVWCVSCDIILIVPQIRLSGLYFGAPIA